MPELPVATAQIPWRTVSIRAIRRRIHEEPQIVALRTSPRSPHCQCSRIAIKRSPEPATRGSMVHNWVSGQQQHHNNSSGSPARPPEHQQSVFPASQDHTGMTGHLTFGVHGNASSTRDPSSDGILVSFAPNNVGIPSAAMDGLHDEACPCYETAPEYQEKDPNPPIK